MLPFPQPSIPIEPRSNPQRPLGTQVRAARISPRKRAGLPRAVPRQGPRCCRGASLRAGDRPPAGAVAARRHCGPEEGSNSAGSAADTENIERVRRLRRQTHRRSSSCAFSHIFCSTHSELQQCIWSFSRLTAANFRFKLSSNTLADISDAWSARQPQTHPPPGATCPGRAAAHRQSSPTPLSISSGV